VKLLVGAYAALRGLDDAAHDLIYEALASNPDAGGLELPFSRAWTDADVAEAAVRLGDHGRALLTTIPGLYRRGTIDPRFGPASEDEEGRRAGVEFLLTAYDAARRLSEIVGPERVAGVVIASSPRRSDPLAKGGIAAFASSLAELAERTSAGPGVTIVEHCDALVERHAPAKGYLDLESEIGVLRALGTDPGRIGIGINWGRSAIEGRAAGHALEHIRRARASGLLTSVVFSGCADRATAYGPAWADAHAPSRAEETGSLLTAEDIAACLAELPASVGVGVKIAARPDASAAERIELLAREIRRVETGRAAAA
jgi:hypothetical protein